MMFRRQLQRMLVVVVVLLLLIAVCNNNVDAFTVDNVVFSSSLLIHSRKSSSSSSSSIILYNNQANGNTNNEPDLFDYFDPLLSPHSYPNGISPDNINAKGMNNNGNSNDNNYDDDNRYEYDPLHFSRSSNKVEKKPFGITTPPPIVEKIQRPAATYPNNDNRPQVDTSTTFDPTISPHEYSNGTVPDVIFGDENADYIIKEKEKSYNNKKKKLGILLIDHGSRNIESNQRLQDMARIYQQSITSTSSSNNNNIIVRAAHMEIATPTIQDGIETLIQDNVDEIICHPYFLSPNGRHVSEDIPRIIQDVINNLSSFSTNNNIPLPPIRITDPIGSRTDIMINIIHSLVEETINN